MAIRAAHAQAAANAPPRDLHGLAWAETCTREDKVPDSTMIAPENSLIPTESFPLANANILALVLGGQLSTDHLMGVGSFFAPSKECPNLVQGTRLRLISEGAVSECRDDGDDTVILKREFVGDSGAVSMLWSDNDWEVEDIYFIPPSPDVVVQRTRITNRAARRRRLDAVAILYPQLGSEVHHKKGACRRAWWDTAASAVLIEDFKDNVLVFAFRENSTGFQVGEVCGRSDVYYDLEDGALSGHAAVEMVVPNAAMSLTRELPAGATWVVETCLGRGSDAESALALLQEFRAQGDALLEQASAHASSILARSPVTREAGELGDRLAAVERRGRLVLSCCLLGNGAPLGGFSCYHNVGQTRNSCYILSALDEMGYHDEVRRGYEHYLNFKVGYDRFASSDENDQLGTILHVFRRRADICGDTELWHTNHRVLESFADRLIALADPANGLIYSERAIHEFVAISRGYETYVNVMAWRGLADAAHMTGLRGDRDKASLYASAAGRLREAIVREMVDPETGSFVKRLYMGRRVALPAISALAPALFGLVEPHHPAVERSITHLKRHIWDRSIGGLHRYPLALQPWQEHPYGGPWITYTSWLGRIHLLRGELYEARELIAWALRNIPADSNLIPEHFSTAHAGKRGFHRIYLDPSTPELWATAEFLRFALAWRQLAASSRV